MVAGEGGRESVHCGEDEDVVVGLVVLWTLKIGRDLGGVECGNKGMYWSTVMWASLIRSMLIK